jgi:GT2 family glycosyltransferase
VEPEPVVERVPLADEKRHMDRVAALGCLLCGQPAQLHHVREGQGMSQRASNFLVVPLCEPHHTGSAGLHGLGSRGFERRYRMDDWQRDDERDVEVVSGCYLVARRAAIEAVGLLDEDFFFFGEETDWCRRFLADGYAVRFAPVGTITHFGGGSSKSLNSKRDLMLSEATVRLHRKHGGVLAAAVAWTILLVFNTSRLAYWSLKSLTQGSGLDRSGHFRGVVTGFHTAWPRAR